MAFFTQAVDNFLGIFGRGVEKHQCGIGIVQPAKGAIACLVVRARCRSYRQVGRGSSSALSRVKSVSLSDSTVFRSSLRGSFAVPETRELLC